MNITVIRRGRVGGDASAADVVDVPGHLIGEALRGVTGLNGQVTIDTTNLSTERDGAVPSLTHQVKSVIGGPTAKAFNTVFASAYELIGEQRATPSNLNAAEPDAKDVSSSATPATTPCMWATSIRERGCWRTVPVSHAPWPARSAFFDRYGRPGEL